jgi:hypothetical protein
VVLGLAFAVLSATLGPVGVVFAAFGLWMAASALVVMAGQVVASGDGLSVRWLRTREIPWSSVDHFAVERRVRWWVTGRFWPPPEVVEVALRPGERVKLWSTIGIREGRLGATNPTAATLMRGLLQRYRDAFAPPP